ncbi:MAG TPA: redoxin domain-containing protein [Gemmatimonadaceae bacterium]|nr:redoxin domain-containing protein [Gemmatimonadaceae bacterium]
MKAKTESGGKQQSQKNGSEKQPGGHTEKLLQPGTEAPNFTLHSTPDQSVSLSEFRGQPVVLVFYPADWSPVCGDQVSLYNEILPEFRKLGAELLGISVDGVWCHAAFKEARNLQFPLLSDFEPKGEVCRMYGAYRDGDGFAERALFVIDGEGKIAWSYCSPVGVNPGADGILSALEDLHEPAGRESA